MDYAFLTALGASLTAAAVTTAGIFVIRRFDGWGRRNSTYFVCFAAGVLITVSFLHIIPKSFSMNENAPVFLFCGYIGMYLFNRFIHSFACEECEGPNYRSGFVPMPGIGLHSFLDGIVYSITFTVGIFTGTLAAIGMVLHEFPEGIIIYLFLLRGGFDEKKSLLFAFSAAAATTPLGMLASFPYISRINEPLLGGLLSFSAGALVYVGATHLLPQAETEHKRFSLLAFGAGIAVALGIIFSKG
jgi:zinc transporter ZupT